MNAGKLASIAILCLLGRTCAAVAEPAPPAEAFGAKPAQTDLTLSPDGHWLAWSDHTSAQARVIIFDLLGRKSQRAVGVPDPAKISSLHWTDNETLLVTLRATREKKVSDEATEEFYRTMAVDAAGGPGRMLLMSDMLRAHVTAARLLKAHTTKPKSVIMETLDLSGTAGHDEIGTRLAGHRADSYWISAVFDVDTRTGKGSIVERGTQFTDDWVIDRDGRVVARSEWDGYKQQYRVLAKAGLGWKELYHREDGSKLDLVGLHPTGGAIVAIGANGGPHQAVWSLPLDGSPIAAILQDPDNDFDHIVKDQTTGEIVGAHLGGVKNTIEWFGAADKQRSEAMTKSFPNRVVTYFGTAADGQQTLVGVETRSNPLVYYIINFATHKAEIAGEEYPALANAVLGTVKEISYKARDGTSIPAFLTLPPGSTGKGLPLVVLPHGGPEAQDLPEFDWLSQFLATRGYAVLQPEFRGSTGYGESFRLAGYRQWGALMQDDVTDGVRAMIEQGIADPKRVAIVGASYGGYAALAGAAFTPELYTCAISISGVSDLPAMLGEAQRWPQAKEYDTVAYWRKSIGAIDDPKLIERSPIHAVTGIRAPILLIHGTGDSVVPISQTERMAHELQAAGKSVKYVKLEGEDHWMSRGEDRIRILKELDAFLHEHL